MSLSTESSILSKTKEVNQAVNKAKAEGNSADEVKAHYANWANNYDEHMMLYNFNGPVLVTKIVNDNCPNKNMYILDVACGTGKVGEHLKEFGFTNVDGLDPSEGMLEIARSKNVYKNYICSAIGAEFSTDIPSNTYDAIVISGAIAPGHLPCESVDEMIRIVKPGGHIFNIGRLSSLQLSEYKDKWEPHLAKKEEEKKWQEISRTIYKNYTEDDNGILYIHKIL